MRAVFIETFPSSRSGADGVSTRAGSARKAAVVESV